MFEFNYDDLEKSRRESQDKFDRLALDPCTIIPKVGWRVVVAAGPLCMGHDWIRLEAEVIELGQISYKVRFTDYRSCNRELVEKWIHPGLVTDVIEVVE